MKGGRLLLALAIGAAACGGGGGGKPRPPATTGGSGGNGGAAGSGGGSPALPDVGAADAARDAAGATPDTALADAGEAGADRSIDAADAALPGPDGGAADRPAADRAPDAPVPSMDVAPRPDAAPYERPVVRADGGVPPGTTAFCSEDGWCWQNPLPHGQDLNDVVGLAPDNYWAVGRRGLVMHWNGSAWRRVDAGTTEILNRIFVFASDDLWIAGENDTLIHWDGRTFTRVPGPETGTGHPAIWGLASNQLWVATYRGVHRYDGTGWRALPPLPQFFGGPVAMYGFAANDIWVLGGSTGAIVRYDGGGWIRQAGVSVTSAFRTVWGATADDVWIGSFDGELLHWDGRALTRTTFPERWSFGTIWGSRPDDVWAVANRTPSGMPTIGRLLRWNGATWAEVDPGGGAPFLAARGTDRDLWAVGRRGAMQRWDGNGWSPRRSVSNDELGDVWASGPNDAWAVDSAGRALRWNGNGWSGSQTPSPWLAAVHGTAPDDVWAIGRNLVHWNGSTWRSLATTSRSYGGAVWAVSRTDAWAAVSDYDFARWNGSTLTNVPRAGAGFQVHGFWGSAPDDIWAVGGGGGAEHWDGARWTRFDTGTTEPLNGVWGSGPSDVWAVGGRGTVVRFRGVGWTVVPGPSPNMEALHAIWGAAANDILVAGSFGALYRWNGATWGAERAGVDLQLFYDRNQIRGLGGAGNRRWAVGDLGLILGK